MLADAVAQALLARAPAAVMLAYLRSLAVALLALVGAESTIYAGGEGVGGAAEEEASTRAAAVQKKAKVGPGGGGCVSAKGKVMGKKKAAPA